MDLVDTVDALHTQLAHGKPCAYELSSAPYVSAKSFTRSCRRSVWFQVTFSGT